MGGRVHGWGASHRGGAAVGVPRQRRANVSLRGGRADTPDIAVGHGLVLDFDAEVSAGGAVVCDEDLFAALWGEEGEGADAIWELPLEL